MVIKRFKPSQKFRVIVGPASFYVTAKQIRYGVGDFIKCNSALQKCLDTLEFQRSGSDVLSCSTGLTGTWEGLQVQISLA